MSADDLIVCAACNCDEDYATSVSCVRCDAFYCAHCSPTYVRGNENHTLFVCVAGCEHNDGSAQDLEENDDVNRENESDVNRTIPIGLDIGVEAFVEEAAIVDAGSDTEIEIDD